MAWNSRRNRSSGLWAFVVQNRLFVLLFVIAVVLLSVSRGQGELTALVRGAGDDLAASAMELVAGPAAEANRWIEGAGTVLSVYEENQRLRDENARLRMAQGELGELQRKVRRYEELLRVPTEAPVGGVAGRVIADMSGPFVRSVLVSVGREQGVVHGQAVVDDRGMLGRIIGTGKRSSRVLLLTDLSSRIPVIVEGANLKAILAGDNSDQPTLEYLPPGSRLTAGARVLTTADGGVLPPGLVVGIVVRGTTSPRVSLFTSERRADFVRVLKYQAPVDVDAEPEASPAPAAPVPSTVPSSAGGAAVAPLPSAALPAAPVAMQLEGGQVR
jgi:rod shape-determining protein MreC